MKFGSMVGSSAPMLQLFERLRRAAASEATVLLEGETGTGKEASALAIHEHSRRSSGPFIVVDCGSIPAQLLESELFGYEKGAFTGAVAQRIGAFEAADGGTVFLDEIGELSLDLQPKILRALEARKFRRLGSNLYLPFDARVIAATNRVLREEVAANRFRSDLYYRLAVVNLRIPVLRERKDDLPALIDEILERLGVLNADEVRAIRSASFIDMLSRYRWPGNVRQLRNYIERRVALGESVPPPGAEPSLLPTATESAVIPRVAVDQPLKEAREEWNTVFECRYLEALLARHGDNVSAAARAAGVNRVYFYRLLWKHGLRDPQAGSPEKS